MFVIGDLFAPPIHSPVEMRVCEVTPYSMARVSGITTLVRDLATWLSGWGHRVVVIGPTPAASDVPAGAEYWAVPTDGPSKDLALAVRTVTALWRQRAGWDLLHIHQAHLQTAAAATLGRLLRRPVVATFHVNPPAAGGLRRFMQRLATRIILTTSSARVFVSEYSRRVFATPGNVVRNGVDLARFRAAASTRGAEREALQLAGVVVAFIGRRTLDKGYFDLLMAAGIVRAKGIDIRIVTAGETSSEAQLHIEQAVREAGLGSAVCDLGVRRDIPEILAAADIFALPSHAEGLPISLLEALAAGLPVIATRVGGISEIVEDGREGFLIAPGEVDVLSDRLLRLATDASLRETMSDHARARSNGFGIEETAGAYLEIFERHFRPGR